MIYEYSKAPEPRNEQEPQLWVELDRQVYTGNMNIVWKNQLDGKYDTYVERVEPYKGELVIKDGDTTLTTKSVTLAYDAKFGPDVEDIQQWENMCVDFIDNQLNKKL